MDRQEEERLMRWYHEIPTDVSSTESDNSDPFEDRVGEYDARDPTYQPDGDESSDSTASNYTEPEHGNDSECLVQPLEPDDEWVENLMEIPDFHFDASAVGIKLDINENTTPYDVFKLL
nr:unnamed protein product [Callosobruchus chinensis]